MRNWITTLFALLLVFSACSDETIEEITPQKPEPKGNKVNIWIEKIMRDNYLWYEGLPDKSTLNFNEDPETFFTRLLSPKDGKDLESGHYYFSYLEKTGQTKSLTNPKDSYGFDFATTSLIMHGQAYKIALVIYVQEDSPANEAGLKRGDWILGVNGSVGSIKDYDMLNHGGNVTLQLGVVKEGNKLSLGRKIEMGASRAIIDTPFLKDSVYTIGGKRIGYLMYNQFLYGPDEYNFDDESYNTHMKQLFKKFKSQKVDEFILDLRYNGGGYVNCAQLLASLLAPREALNKTFCTFEYNKKNTKNNSSIHFLNTADVLAGNLNLKRLYVLTGQSTASSSELVINGLRPYIPVKTIGNKTVGKTVGMTIYDETTKYGWVLAPITFRTYNAQHKADYEDGFLPDFKINEYEYKIVEFGDLNDPLLGKAIEEITGQPTLRSVSPKLDFNIQYQPGYTHLDNLLFRSERIQETNKN